MSHFAHMQTYLTLPYNKLCFLEVLKRSNLLSEGRKRSVASQILHSCLGLSFNERTMVFLLSHTKLASPQELWR